MRDVNTDFVILGGLTIVAGGLVAAVTGPLEFWRLVRQACSFGSLQQAG